MRFYFWWSIHFYIFCSSSLFFIYLLVSFVVLDFFPRSNFSSSFCTKCFIWKHEKNDTFNDILLLLYIHFLFWYFLLQWLLFHIIIWRLLFSSSINVLLLYHDNDNDDDYGDNRYRIEWLPLFIITHTHTHISELYFELFQIYNDHNVRTDRIHFIFFFFLLILCYFRLLIL